MGKTAAQAKMPAPAIPVEVTDESFDNLVIRSGMPVLLEFYSPECMHCQKMAKVVVALASELSGKVPVVRVNVLENALTPERYEVGAIPAFFLINGGLVLHKAVGAMSKGRLKKELGLGA